MVARGYTGSKSGFRAIVSRLRPRRAAEAYVRRAVLPGEEAQVDWAHFGKVTVGRAERPLRACSGPPRCGRAARRVGGA